MGWYKKAAIQRLLKDACEFIFILLHCISIDTHVEKSSKSVGKNTKTPSLSAVLSIAR